MASSPTGSQLDIWRNRARDDVDFIVDSYPTLEALRRGSVRTASFDQVRRASGHVDPTADAAIALAEAPHRQLAARALKLLDELSRLRAEIHMTAGLRVCPICRKDVLPDQATTRRYGELIHDLPACKSKAQRRQASTLKAA